MATQILMPALSPTMEEGTLARWLVKPGDAVTSGQILAEIETDKATMEFEAVDEGTIGDLLVPEGTAGVKVNAPIATLLAEGEDASAGGAAAPAAAQAQAAAAGGGGAAGDQAKADDVLSAQRGYGADGGAPTGPASGTAAPAAAPPSAAAFSGPGGAAARTVGTMATAGAGPAVRAASAGGAAAAGGARIFASPPARRLAAEKGIDLAAVTGSGPHGRIVRADIDAAQPGTTPAAQPGAGPAVQPGAVPAAPPAPTAAAPAAAQGMSADTVRKLYAGRAFDEMPLDGMRRTIAQRLTEAKQTIPHFYLRRSARIDALLAFRGQLNGALEARGVKLSVNDFIIKACALALQEVPDANAVWAGDRILKLKPSDVGVAVAVDGGLFVPVLKDAEVKTLSALSAEMKDLAARAKAKKLAPAEYQGGSFAISNLGMFGIENFDAVINPPHGAILAVGAGIRQPVVEGEQIAIATVMSITLSVDHRVIDGALGAQLLDRIVGHLENPVGMLA